MLAASREGHLRNDDGDSIMVLRSILYEAYTTSPATFSLRPLESDITSLGSNGLDFMVSVLRHCDGCHLDTIERLVCSDLARECELRRGILCGTSVVSFGLSW
jgi:hypothetical protein